MTASLSANPGHLRLSVPAGFDANSEDVPYLRRFDMGQGDFTLETYLDHPGASVDERFRAGLMVAFSRTDLVHFGLTDDNHLFVYRSGEGYSLFTPDSFPIYLRVEKFGNQFQFFSKHTAGASWVLQDTRTFADPVTAVGVNLHSFFTGNAPTSIDLGYFQLERYGPLTPPPSATLVFDDFDTPLDPDWDWYVPAD